ncbi:calcium-binding protein [Sphingomonas ginkgonis]|uniref:Calcium-binding protein n=1 Tax=Sphingomonas ginkgonis TaxID=2315330 RepID=A0A429VC21_9SPHN|nr:calcium-binding protein [Sphingomonas ginkgonis]RST31437.1 calcium-binding protein [Sphingomonas ginkgonis]
MTTYTLTQDYGYNSYRVSGLAAGSVIDATKASWIVDNSRTDNPDANTAPTDGTGPLNTYPFGVDSAGAGLLIKGGAIWGQVPQTSDWQYTYNNSAALRIANAPGVIIDDWRLDKTWDAIRVTGTSNNFLIDDAHLSNVRDDALENDDVLSGTIRDSLFDGVFSGISLGDSDHKDGSMNTVSLDHVFMRSESYLYKGDVTHVSPFKTDTGAPGTTPDIRIVDSVIAIEDPNHAGQARLKLAWDNVVESHGNVYLNLSDTPLPSSYPKPPAGFTILQGQQARDFWEACKKAWLDNHDGVNDVAVTPLPPLPGTAPAPTPTPSPTPSPTGTSINGTSGADTLTGSAAADTINGLAGDDKIFGKGGADLLSGGAGKDKFVFDTAADGHFGHIGDFNVGEDRIYLDDAIFKGIGTGSMSSPVRLSGGYFEHGDGIKADDSTDHILYDSASGILSYDPDGNGSAAPIPVVQLSAHLDLTKYDIYVV